MGMVRGSVFHEDDGDEEDYCVKKVKYVCVTVSS